MNDINQPLNLPDSLDSFINKMQISPNSKKKFFYMDYFNFCIRVLTQNNLSQTFHIFIWTIISLLYDIALTGVSTPLKKISDDSSTDTALFSNITFHMLAFIMQCLLAGFTIYQVIYYFKFGSPSSISTFRANLLYFSFYFFPQLAAIVCGFLFGKMFLEALKHSITSATAFFYAISLFLLYFLLILSRAAFINIVAYHISPNGGIFSFYSPVVNTTDLLTFYIISAFLPLRSTQWYYYTTIASVISFIWGIVKLVFTIRNHFMTNFAAFILTRLYFDAIVFGAFGIITTWISFDQQLILEFWALIFFLDVIGTYIFNRHLYHATKRALTPSNGHLYTEEHILRPLTALVYMRSGIAYQMENAVSLDFMQFVLSHRFSEEALADIIRICISRNVNLSSIQYTHFVLKRKHTMRMRFLATQAILFKRSVAGDSDPEVAETVARLSHEADALETITDNFWTDRDTKQLNIISLAKEVRRVKKLFTASLMEFGKSEEIRDHWNQFAEVTLCAPHKATVAVPMLFTRVNSQNSPLAFGIEPDEGDEPIKKKKKKQQGMTIEKYVERLTNKITFPFKLIYFASLIIFLIAMVTINILYYTKLTQSNYYVNMYTSILQLTTALAHNILRESDKATSLQDSATIATIIGISIDEAKTFRQKIAINTDSITNPAQYLNDLIAYVPPTAPDGCPNISVSLLARQPQEGFFGTEAGKRCFYMWTYEHIHYIDLYRESILSNFTPNIIGPRYKAVIIAFTLFGIIDFIMLIVCCSLIHRRWKSLLEIVRQITAVKTQRTETKEPDQSLYATYIFLFMVTFALGCILAFYIFEVEYEKVDSLSYELMKQDEAISIIARDSMMMLSYVERSALDPVYAEKMMDMNRECMKAIIAETQYVTTTNSSYMNEIYPLNKWQTMSVASFSQLVYDLTQLLMDDHFIKGDYNFLMSRYIIINNITGLVINTIPQMLTVTSQTLQGLASSIWVWTIVFILFVLAMTILFKYILSRQKLWLYGVKYILRREMSVSQSRMKRIISMIEGYAESIFEKVPQPSYVVSKGDIIVMCNELAARLSSQTIPQMIGQKLSDYFGAFAPIKTLTINNCVMTFKFLKEPFGKDLDLIIVLDISKQVRYREKEQVIAELLKPKIENIPVQAKIIVICIRINCPVDSFNDVVQTLSESEEKHKDVKRIAVGATYYKAVAMLKDGAADECTKFASEVLEKWTDICSVAIITGLGTIVGVVENDTIDAVCSEASKRANQIVRDAPKGRCFIDWKLSETLQNPIESYFEKGVPIVVSPLSQE